MYLQPNFYTPNVPDLCSPTDGSEITSFQKTVEATLKSPDENHFANTPQNRSPANDFRSEDCNEILEKELADLDDATAQEELRSDKFNLVSQSSIEIEIRVDENEGDGAVENADARCDIRTDMGEVISEKYFL